METFITELIKLGGGYILAGLMAFMLNELWKARYKEQCDRTSEVANDRKILLDTLDNNTKVKQEVVLTLQAMQRESHVATEKLQQSIESVTSVLSERAAAAVLAADAAKIAAQAAMAAAQSAAKTAARNSKKAG